MRIYEVFLKDATFHLLYRTEADKAAHENGERDRVLSVFPANRSGSATSPRRSMWPDFLGMPLPLQPHLIVSERARFKLSSLIDDDVEYERIEITGAPCAYHLMRPLRVTDPIVRNESDIVEIAEGYSRLRRRTFKKDFRYPSIFVLAPPFLSHFEQVTEEFVSMVSKCDLKGLTFVDYSVLPPRVIE